jgi:hypothetical protein
MTPRRAVQVGLALGVPLGLVLGIRAAVVQYALVRWSRAMDLWRRELYRADRRHTEERAELLRRLRPRW